MKIEISVIRASNGETVEWSFDDDRKEAARFWNEMKNGRVAPDSGFKVRSGRMIVDGKQFDSFDADWSGRTTFAELNAGRRSVTGYGG